MSDQIKHECGIVLIRLLKPLSFYKQKYGTDRYGLEKLYLIMEKQHNRGQEAAGVACVKLEASPGEEYIYRDRAMGNTAISTCFTEINRSIHQAKQEGTENSKLPYLGEVYMGHLRYSTTGKSGMSYVHPFLRRNNWRSRNLCIAGNFNLTNVHDIMTLVESQGQHPRSNADTFIMLEQLGYLLDDHHHNLFRKYRSEGYTGKELDKIIEENIDIEGIISEASKIWDGGFCIIGATGSGESFVFKDKWGIRPCSYYIDDEIVVVASEKAVIQTAMNVPYESVKELGAGESITIKRDGTIKLSVICKPENVTPCSFERIYFSRGSDGDIYKERKTLGRLLSEQILKEIDNNLDDTVFSFIPNTAEVAYYGMIEGVNDYLNTIKCKKISSLKNGENTPDKISEILNHKIRTEKLAIKDIKLRTFIAEGSSRDDLATHVYDITYNTIIPNKDTIVIIDDSIVRGTTLKQSIIKILSRLDPVKIVIVSSSPQVRYPDCYGIDMSRMGEFIAFNAAVELHKERGTTNIMEEVYNKCKDNICNKNVTESVNYVKEVYEPFTEEEISKKIAEMVTPPNTKCKVSIIYQTVGNLHKACPKHSGDWYFSGNYPTPGGNRIVNLAYINFYEGNKEKR